MELPLGARSPQRLRTLSAAQGLHETSPDDRFTAALTAKLEDVGLHCSNEVVRLKREVTRLHEENGELRHQLRHQLRRQPEKDSSDSPEPGGSSHSGSFDLYMGQSIRDNGTHSPNGRSSLASSPIERRRHFNRTSTEAASRKEQRTSSKREAAKKYQPGLSAKRREDQLDIRKEDELDIRKEKRSDSWDTSKSLAHFSHEVAPTPQQLGRSNRRHQTAPVKAHNLEVRITGPGGEAESQGRQASKLSSLQIPSHDTPKHSVDSSAAGRSVSEAAALAAALVKQGKGSSGGAGERRCRVQGEEDSGESEDDDAKSGCSDTSFNKISHKLTSRSCNSGVPMSRSKSAGSTMSRRDNDNPVPACILASRSNMQIGLQRQTSQGFDVRPSRDSAHSAVFVFEPLPHWRHVAVKRKRFAKTRRSIDVCKEMQMALQAQEQHTKSYGPINFISKHMMISPTTMRCIVFDLIGVVLIGYELVFLPMQVFDMPNLFVFKCFDWIQRMFWTLAIFRSFFVGYVAQDGTVELRPGKVAKNYICSWLPFDLFIMVFDWMEVIMSGAEFVSAARVTKTVRFTRIIRIFRLARMAKLPRLLEEFDARFISERTILLLGIVKITFLFACVGHLLACFWYGLGRYWGYNGRSWVTEYNVLNETTAYQYTTSLHWALSQFQGSMEVMPQNTYERNYAAWVLVFTFVSASVFVSRITAAYTRLQIIAGGNERKFSELRTFLQSNSISSSLAMRVMRSAQFSVSQSIRQMAEEDIELLGSITEPLRIEIHYEIFRPHLTVHPFFRWINAAHGGAMRHLCQSAVQVLAVSQGDLLFSEGQEAMNPRMFFVMSGSLTYNCDLDEVPVGKGTWFSEGTLWIQWVHVGDLLAMSEGQICALRADLYQETMSKFYDLAIVCVKYAAAYVKKLNSCPHAICDLHRGYVVEELMEHALSAFGPRTSSNGISSRRLSWGGAFGGTKSWDPTCDYPYGSSDYPSWMPDNKMKFFGGGRGRRSSLHSILSTGQSIRSSVGGIYDSIGSKLAGLYHTSSLSSSPKLSAVAHTSSSSSSPKLSAVAPDSDLSPEVACTAAGSMPLSIIPSCPETEMAPAGTRRSDP